MRKGKTKTKALLTVPLKQEVLKDFQKACELRGANMSTLVRQFVMLTIREERLRERAQVLGGNRDRTSGRGILAVVADHPAQVGGCASGEGANVTRNVRSAQVARGVVLTASR